MRKFSAAQFLVSLVVAMCGGTTATLAEPVVRQTHYYYDVAGSTPQELRADLDRHGPFDQQGRRFDGFTRWYVRWRYTYASDPQRCAIESVSTTVDIAITLPRLASDTSASASLQQSFSTYVEKLHAHENGHAQIAIDIGKRIEDGIRALPPETGCDRLGQIANDLGYSLIREANQQEIDYDARTQHGRTQGVQFP